VRRAVRIWYFQESSDDLACPFHRQGSSFTLTRRTYRCPSFLTPLPALPPPTAPPSPHAIPLLQGTARQVTAGTLYTGLQAGINEVLNLELPIALPDGTGIVPTGGMVVVEVANQRHGNVTLSINRDDPAGLGGAMGWRFGALT